MNQSRHQNLQKSVVPKGEPLNEVGQNLIHSALRKSSFEYDAQTQPESHIQSSPKHDESSNSGTSFDELIKKLNQYDKIDEITRVKQEI